MMCKEFSRITPTAGSSLVEERQQAATQVLKQMAPEVRVQSLLLPTSSKLVKRRVGVNQHNVTEGQQQEE